jgi:DNA-binding PadR family transcriptional regulator
VTDDQPTTLEYALLGLISLAPMSGYDVHRAFDTTPLAHFSSSLGAIYPALRRLERRGLLKARLDRATEANPRRVFSITAAGEAALQAWVRRPVTREELIGTGRPLLRFGLAGGRLTRTEAVTYLREWGRVLDAYLEELRGHQAAMEAQPPVRPHSMLALEHGIWGFECQRRWIDYAIAQVRSRKPDRRRGRR